MLKMRSSRAQRERGLVMASRGSRRNTTISTKAKKRTLPQSFSKDLVSVLGQSGSVHQYAV